MNYDPKSMSRTQDLKPLFEETAGSIVLKKSLDRNGTRIGNTPYLVEVSAIEGIDMTILKILTWQIRSTTMF